jgi:hypothetical protein
LKIFIATNIAGFLLQQNFFLPLAAYTKIAGSRMESAFHEDEGDGKGEYKKHVIR